MAGPMTHVNLSLRDYQLAAVENAVARLSQRRNPVIVLPTGAGKSLVIAELARRLRDGGVLALAHRRELVAQNAAAYERLTGRRASVLCAGLDRHDMHGPVLFASVQTAASRLEKLPRFAVLLVDECHLIPRDPGSQYRRVIGAMGEPGIVGLSATPYRLDAGSVVDHPDIPLDVVATHVTAAELVKRGFLCPLVLDDRRTAEIDTEKVRKRAGEFVQGELAKRAMVEALVEQQVAIAMRTFKGRRSLLVFCVSKDHAGMVNTRLRALGETVATVTEDTPTRERDAALEAFREGRLRWIVNVDVLTTGFDAPSIDGILVLRPTLSKGLFVQMIGRGYRMAPGKSDCLVLDFGGNIRRHEPLDDLGAARHVDGSAERAEAERKAAETRSWYDRVLREDKSLDLGTCGVLRWKVKTEPSRSCPGTRHVHVTALLRDGNGIRHWINVWYTPEHRNRFARYRAMQAARRAGWNGYSLDAATMARLLERLNPAQIEARRDEKGFWRISWRPQPPTLNAS